MTVNVNEKLNKLEQITGYPTSEGVYEGGADKYITYVYSDERCTLHADDEENQLTAYIQLTLYTPHDFNYHSNKRQIKAFLIEEGFFVTSIQSFVERSADESLIRHTVFECNITIPTKEV